MENKIKKSWFNAKLYLDGLKQLRIIGIMGAVIMACAAILIPLGRNIDNANYREYYGNGYSEIVGRVRVYGVIEMNPLIVLVFLIVVPLMTLYLFNFLNRRNACDFYHAIPDTRESLFASYGGSIITWALILVTESVILSVCSAGVFKWVELVPGFLGQTVLIGANILAASVFVFGVFAIAMSVTGTNFTNLAVAAMLLITPRLMATAFVAMMTEKIPLIPFNFGDSILDDRLNVVTNLVTGWLWGSGYEAIRMWSSFAYTLVVGIIYCAIGMWLFKKRKSEAATNAAISSKLQCLLRLIPAMLICLVPIYGFYSYIMDGHTMTAEDIFIFVVLYVIAIIAYLLYELITTRKLKNLIKALPGLGWLVVYNVVMVVILFAGYHILLNDMPKAADVNSVKISFQNYYYSYGSNRDYYADKFENIVYDSPEIIELLTSELERNVEAIKNDESLYGNRYPVASAESADIVYTNTTEYKGVDVVESYIDLIEVRFDCGLFDKNRRVYLSRQASMDLLKLMADNDQILEALYEPVELDSISTMSISDFGNSEELKKELYEIYLVNSEEMKSLGFDKAFNSALGVDSDSDWLFTINVYLKNDKRFNVRLGNNTPKSLKMYVELCNRLSGDADPVEEFFESYDRFKAVSTNSEFLDADASVRFTIYNEEGREFLTSADWNFWNSGNEISGSKDYTENGEKLLKSINSMLMDSKTENIDFGKKYVKVTCEIYEYSQKLDNDGEKRVIKFYQLSDEAYKALCEFDGRDPIE